MLLWKTTLQTGRHKYTHFSPVTHTVEPCLDTHTHAHGLRQTLSHTASQTDKCACKGCYTCTDTLMLLPTLSSEARDNLSKCEMTWKKKKKKLKQSQKKWFWGIHENLSKRANHCRKKQQIYLKTSSVGTFGWIYHPAGLTAESQSSRRCTGAGCWPNCSDLPCAPTKENDTSSLDVCT